MKQNQPDKDRVKEIQDTNQKCYDTLFKDMPPFTITINNGFDAGWVSTAMFQYLSGGDDKFAERGFILMTQCVKKYGVEDGINRFFKQANSLDVRYPAFLKPMFIHLFEYALKQIEEENEKGKP